jgi:uncharacterized MnhB-related membrane protein
VNKIHGAALSFVLTSSVIYISQPNLILSVITGIMSVCVYLLLFYLNGED